MGKDRYTDIYQKITILDWFFILFFGGGGWVGFILNLNLFACKDFFTTLGPHHAFLWKKNTFNGKENLSQNQIDLYSNLKLKILELWEVFNLMILSIFLLPTCSLLLTIHFRIYFNKKFIYNLIKIVFFLLASLSHQEQRINLEISED